MLELTGDAVYCARNGDGALLPDSMVCRIDRQTLDATVRVFPAPDVSVVVQPCFEVPAGWTIDTRTLDVTDLSVRDSTLEAVAADGTTTTLDPRTLAPVAADVRAVAPTAAPAALGSAWYDVAACRD
jgi:hypothetical protein